MESLDVFSTRIGTMNQFIEEEEEKGEEDDSATPLGLLTAEQGC